MSGATKEMIEAAARAVGYRDYIKGMHNAPEKAKDWSAGHYHMYTGIAETALQAGLAAAPQPAWQNLDRIIDVLEAAGCCKDGRVHAPEDVVANALRDWLRSDPRS